MKTKLPIYIFFFVCIFTSQNVFSQTDPNPNFDKPLLVDEVNFKFKDGDAFSEGDLSGIIFTKPGEEFNADELPLDMQRIEKFYFDNGYFDARVDTLFQYNDDTTEISVEFTVTQNKPYKINNIEYLGLDSISPSLRTEIFKNDAYVIKKGQVYSKNNVNLEVVRILTILGDNGYAFADKQEIIIEKIMDANPTINHLLNIQILIKTGEIYYFGKTNITIKNNKYDVNVNDFYRDLQYSEGELFSKEKLARTQNKIASVSLLESSTFDTAGIDPSNNRINYNVTITLRNKYELSPELVGYSISQKFYGGAGLLYTDRYFFGGGRVFNGRIRGLFHTLEDNVIEITGTVNQPYLFNNENINGNITASLSFLTDDRFKVVEIKNSNGVSYDLPSYTYINRVVGEWELINQNITTKVPLLAYDPETEDSVVVPPFNVNVFSSRLSFTGIHNGLNNLLYPTAGFYQTNNVQESGLLGYLVKKIFNTHTYQYLKFLTINKYFMSFTQDPLVSVLGVKFATGILYEYSDNTIMVQDSLVITSDVLPNDFKFVAGGPSSNRGWRARQLGFVPDQQTGGNFLLEGSFEYRIRPFLSSKNFLLKDLGFVTFIDYGNVWSNVKDFKLDQVAISIGPGIRYYTVIGAIRLDLGFKLYDPNPGPVGVTKWLFQSGANFSDKYAIQFGIGNTF